MSGKKTRVPRPSKPRVSGSSPLGRASFPKASVESRLRLLTEIRGPSECWPWLGPREKSGGYGSLSVNGRRQRVHRVVFKLAYGDPGPDAVVRHLCSHPWCVNVRHLRAGTTADNMRDKVLAGRQAKGERNGRAKLSEADAREIVRLVAAGHRITYVARDFGVSRRAVRLLCDGKNWAHIHARPEQAVLLVGQ